MKKFISWVSAVAVFVSVISCREAEELTTTPDEIQNQSISAKVKKDSVGINSNSSNESSSLEAQESDPPPKNDGIKW
ncbi:hypothetical protein EG349_16965 [Chryseobacterium shandongense]|uniref:Uncharacterized protein n=2 Tax=Chryseobacterium TaxID=59732 RepID=A0A3D9B9C8_9FLAO|nr:MULTISPECIES: hypothetical protein [Chryseobacterium group]AZA88340.1 hypothetical protein EG349_16965 [Chryseobacterium shandongense]REC49949.1 hypothetical protein DRF68_09955 [Candidatus Chryseobacterium massiliae]